MRGSISWPSSPISTTPSVFLNAANSSRKMIRASAAGPSIRLSWSTPLISEIDRPARGEVRERLSGCEPDRPGHLAHLGADIGPNRQPRRRVLVSGGGPVVPPAPTGPLAAASLIHQRLAVFQHRRDAQAQRGRQERTRWHRAGTDRAGIVGGEQRRPSARARSAATVGGRRRHPPRPARAVADWSGARRWRRTGRRSSARSAAARYSPQRPDRPRTPSGHLRSAREGRPRRSDRVALTNSPPCRLICCPGCAIASIRSPGAGTGTVMLGPVRVSTSSAWLPGAGHRKTRQLLIVQSFEHGSVERAWRD